MPSALLTQRELAEQFKHLHASGKLLVLPNVWDAGSAVIFEKAGFNALGTTSAGIAYSLAYPDGEAIAFEDILACTKRILKRINVPLSVDIETGYSDTLEGIVFNTKKVIGLGAVGINIEDGIATPIHELTDTGLQSERVKALAQLKTELDIPFVINARTDAYWLGIGDPKDRLRLTLERAHAYAEAGADCIFVPGDLNRRTTQTLVKEIPLPLNLIAPPKGLSIEELEALGVARLSLGSGPARAALGLIQTVASELKQGSFDSMMQNATPYHLANELFCS